MAHAALVRSPNKADRGPYAWRDMARAVWAWYADRVPEAAGEQWEPDVLVLEGQQVYSTRFQKGNQDDLLQLAGVCGAIAYAFQGSPEMHSYLPRLWKGQVPQKVFSERLWNKLTPEERSKYEPCPASLRHNIDHAVGLGAYHLAGKR